MSSIAIQDLEKMVLFVDISGSVSNFTKYWTKVSKFYQENLRNIAKIFIWDNKIEEVTPVRFKEVISKKDGFGGTAPSLIANKLHEIRHFNNIVIFTDGDIGDSEVQRTDQLLKGLDINNISCYIISQNLTSQINLSVVCPFTRNNTSSIYYIGSDRENFVSQQQSAADFGILEQIQQMDYTTFITQYDLIESVIIRRNMGRAGGDVQTKNMLLALKNKIIKELSTMSRDDNYGDQIRYALQSNDAAAALATAKTMTNKYFGDCSDIGMEIERKISYLVSLCGDMRGMYNLQQIRSSRYGSAASAVVSVKPDVAPEATDLVSTPVMCPIMMDDAVMQILLLKGDDDSMPILASLDKRIVDDIIDCPLRILNHSDIRRKLIARIGHAVGTDVQNLQTDPFNRQPVEKWTIPFGNCEQHVKCGNYALTKLFTNGKILGNINLYYAVIWYLIHTGEIQFLSDIKDQVTEHLVYRLTNSMTNASLCGLGQFVTTKVPTDVAIWYVLNSCMLNQPTDRDTVRYHMFNLDVMLEIITVLKYPMSDGAMKQINRTKIMLSMLSMVKRDCTKFRSKIRALYQNCLPIDMSLIQNERFLENEEIIEWIPLDGPATQAQVTQILASFPDYFAQLSIDELVGLASLVDPSKSASAIGLPITWNPSNTISLINWTNYGLNKYPREVIAICPNTFRPYSKVNHLNEQVDWKVRATNLFGNESGWFSCYRKFIDYFMKYQCFPNREEYLLFCYNRSISKLGTNVTIPFQIDQWTDELFESYQPIMELIASSQMVSADISAMLNRSATIEDRVQMEQYDL